MPVYEHVCSECGERSELRRSHELERLIPAPSLLRSTAKTPGTTCCGREERCDAPPCSSGDTCRRHQGPSTGKNR